VHRDDPVPDRLRERFAEERREEMVLLAGRLDLPRAASAPIGVRLRIRTYAIQEVAFVDPGEVEHDRDRHHLLGRCFAGRRTRAEGDVRIAGCIDHAAGEDRFAAGFGFGHVSLTFSTWFGSWSMESKEQFGVPARLLVLRLGFSKVVQQEIWKAELPVSPATIVADDSDRTRQARGGDDGGIGELELCLRANTGGFRS
jgi:hypothetical protein